MDLTHEDNRRSQEAERQRQLEEDTVLPYWEVELLKGPEHLKAHEHDFRYYKNQDGKIFDRLCKKKSIYVTSGGDDMSLISLATIQPGPLPPFVSAGLILFNAVDKILIQPKEIVRDGIFLCNTTVSRFFITMNRNGHKICKIEEAQISCSSPELNILELETGHNIAKFKRKGWNRQYRQGMDVYSPKTNHLGSVEYTWKKHPTFYVKNDAGTLLFMITSENHRCCCETLENLKFSVRTHDGICIGNISADWDDLTYLLYLSHHLYGITFPIEMNVIHKLLLIAAAIQVYYAKFNGKIIKQVVHLPKKDVKDFISYEYLRATDTEFQEQGDESTISDSTDRNSEVRPLVRL